MAAENPERKKCPRRIMTKVDYFGWCFFSQIPYLVNVLQIGAEKCSAKTTDQKRVNNKATASILFLDLQIFHIQFHPAHQDSKYIYLFIPHAILQRIAFSPVLSHRPIFLSPFSYFLFFLLFLHPFFVAPTSSVFLSPFSFFSCYFFILFL